MLKILTLLATLSLSHSAYSSPTPALMPEPAAPSQASEKEAEVKHSDQGKYQQVVEEYKAYVATVDKSVRDEIVSFRKEMVKLNKQKHSMYKTLSQEAQQYLAKERELKRKLPVDQRKTLTDDAAK